MSTNHAPGEQPHIVEVKDQRLSFFLVSVVLGFSVLISPVLKLVPYAVLFGVFLYMGVSSIGAVQLFDRVALLLKPVKYHPTVSYVRKVKFIFSEKATEFDEFSILVISNCCCLLRNPNNYFQEKHDKS
jgi:hypothetical protein